MGNEIFLRALLKGFFPFIIGDLYKLLLAGILIPQIWKFAKSIKPGVRVRQGQIIGYVGSTGMSTGPHLHYEFHVNGKHTDPLKVEFPYANPIEPSEKIKFDSVAYEISNQLSNYKNITVKEEVPSG